MASRTHSFPVSGRAPAIEIRNPAGSVTLEARDGREELVVDVTALDATAEQLLDAVAISCTDSRLSIVVPERRLSRTPSFAVSVTSPPDAELRIATASAGTTLRGRFGAAELTSASGDVAVEDVASLQLRTASGDARVGAVTGPATAVSASGALRIGTAAGGLTCRTASGDVGIREAAGEVSVATASGGVVIGRITQGDVRVKTMSGDTEVGVAPDRRVWLDLSSVSGRMDSQLTDDDGPAAGEGGARVSLTLRSVSGDLRIRKVAGT